MLHILICDDDKRFAEILENLLKEEMHKKQIEYCCQSFYCGQDFLQEPIYEKELIFMDIELPDISGLKIAEHLKEKNRNKNLIFLTNHEYLVFPSLKCYPFYFMQKSELKEELGRVLEEFLKERIAKKEDRIFEYCVKNNVYHILLDEITYLTYWEHRVSLMLQTGERIEFRGKIKDCEQQLNGLDFFKANKGTFVNLKYCQRLDEDGFWMRSGENITVSRERKKDAKLCFMKYRRGNNANNRNDI